jgi:hypothetical protein
MRAEGQVVAIAQLGRWFSVPRSTFYYHGERPKAMDPLAIDGCQQLPPHEHGEAAQPVVGIFDDQPTDQLHQRLVERGRPMSAVR